MRACYPNQLDYMGFNFILLCDYKSTISLLFCLERMPIDINLLRAFKGGVPELVRLSQLKRFADVGLVDKVIALDDVPS